MEWVQERDLDSEEGRELLIDGLNVDEAVAVARDLVRLGGFTTVSEGVTVWEKQSGPVPGKHPKLSNTRLLRPKVEPATKAAPLWWLHPTVALATLLGTLMTVLVVAYTDLRTIDNTLTVVLVALIISTPDFTHLMLRRVNVVAAIGDSINTAPEFGADASMHSKLKAVPVIVA